jgi:hypothetical protein
MERHSAILEEVPEIEFVVVDSTDPRRMDVDGGSCIALQLQRLDLAHGTCREKMSREDTSFVSLRALNAKKGQKMAFMRRSELILGASQAATRQAGVSCTGKPSRGFGMGHICHFGV